MTGTALCDDCGRLVAIDYGQWWPPFWVCFNCYPKRPDVTPVVDWTVVPPDATAAPQEV